MYAIFKDGATQVKAKEGDVVVVSFRAKLKAGDKVEFPSVQLVSDKGSVKVGTPNVAGAKVTGEVVDQVKGDKVWSFKFRRRKNSRRIRGHRQKYTQVKITSVKG